MKTHPTTLAILLLSASLLTTGCSKEESAPAPAPAPQPVAPTTPPADPGVAVAPVPSADPCAEMKTALEAATLEAHSGLAAIQQRMDRDIDAQVAARKAGYNVSLASDEKLDSASEDFAEKLRMLSVAREETWNSAKHDAGLALQNVHSAYAEIMRSPPRK